jgi:hypothetical protein
MQKRTQQHIPNGREFEAKVIEKGKGLLPDNEPVHPKTVKIISKGNVVRDGKF